MKIIFEDEFLIALDKPRGVHSSGTSETIAGSMAEYLHSLYPNLENVSERKEDCGLVNRLDFETSGILLAAKTKESWNTFRRAIQCGEIKKSYLALVEGRWEERLELLTFIGNPNRSAPKVRVYTERPRKKDRALLARSGFEPIKADSSGRFSVVRVLAPTARRHQVRAHAAHAGHPLVGDVTYGATTEVKDIMPEITAKFLLHAATVEFVHPSDGKKVAFSSPCDFAEKRI